MRNDVTITDATWQHLWEIAKSEDRTIGQLLEDDYGARFLHNNGITWTIRFIDADQATFFALRWA